MTYFSKKIRAAALAAPAALLCSGTAFAAGASQDFPEKSIAWGASVHTEYKSNTLQSSDQAVLAGNKKSDWVTEIDATLNVVMPFGRQAWFMDSSVGYEFYKRYNELDSWRANVRSGLQLNLMSNCSGTVAGDYVREQSDLGDIVTIGNPGNTPGTGSIMNIENRWGGGVDFDCGSVVGLLPGFSYRHEEVTNSSSLRKRSNVVYDEFTVRIGYTRPSLGTVAIYGLYRDGRYPNRNTVVAGVPITEGIKKYGAGLRFDRDIGALLQGSVSVGYEHVDPKTPGTPSFNGISFAGDITWTPTDRVQSTIAIGRGAEQSNLFETAYTIRTRFDWNTTIALSERADVTSGISYSHRNFRISNLLPGQVARPSDTTWEIHAGAGYKIGRIWRVGVDAAHEWRNSNAIGRDWKDTRIGFSVGVEL